PGGSDDTSQAGALYRLMTPDQQAQLIANLVAPLKTVPHHIQVRQIGQFLRADEAYGSRVTAGLGVSLDELRRRADEPPRSPG
ncbi:MAG: catalase, partial [Pseudomonadota bacterium]